MSLNVIHSTFKQKLFKSVTFYCLTSACQHDHSDNANILILSKCNV